MIQKIIVFNAVKNKARRITDSKKISSVVFLIDLDSNTIFTKIINSENKVFAKTLTKEEIGTDIVKIATGMIQKKMKLDKYEKILLNFDFDKNVSSCLIMGENSGIKVKETYKFL